MSGFGLATRWGLLLGTPLLIWLALPGRFSFWPLLLVGLVPLFSLVGSACSANKALLYGLISGMFFYILQLYWSVYVLNRYGALPYYIAVPAMLLLVLYMSLYLALFSLGLHLLLKGSRLLLLFVGGPALWVGLDWSRSWLFGGFPWMDIGYGLWSEPWLLQGADLFGHYGYSFLIVSFNLVIYLFLDNRFSVLQRVVSTAALGVLLGVLGLYSAQRWTAVHELMHEAPTARIGVVQGNVSQEQKWSPALRRATTENYVAMSQTLLQSEPPLLLVWPETALPFYPRNKELLQPVSDFLDDSGADVLTGAPWYEVESGTASRRIHYFNSALLLSRGGAISGSYYKSHLVPYGEYVPLQKYLSFLAPLVEAAGDFTPGTVGEPLASGTIRAGVLICYESIFGSIGRRWVENGANILINLTNDAWYGKSSAPFQSWAMSLFRSVETRRSLVRSANTGISGFIDPLGRIREESELFVPWSKAAQMVLMDTKTVYIRAGYLFAPLCAALAAVMVVLAGLGRRKNTRDGGEARS